MNIGPYPIDDIYCGKSEELLAKLPDGCIDLTVTSPPYDDMDDYFNPLPARGLRQYNGYTWDFKELARQLYRVTKPGGVVVWVVGDPTIDGSESLASSLQKIYFRRLGFNLHDTMIYHRHCLPMTHNRYEQHFEYMFVFSKDSPRAFNAITERAIHAGDKHSLATKSATTKEAKSRNGRTDNPVWIRKEEKIIGNVWYRPVGKGLSATDNIAYDHPAIFPEALARDHIISWSNPGDIVLDPFAGSGTTAKMSKLFHRHWLGFDISQEYVDLARRRVAAAIAPDIRLVEQPAKPRQDVLL